MAKLFRLLFLALFATALVWAAVIWHWQNSSREVQAQDIVLYLLVLPLVLVGGFLMLRWAWRRAGMAQAAAAASSAAAAPVVASATAPERQLTMRVLAQGVACAGADSAEALLELLAEPPQVAIDPELRDADGMGVFTRRCKEADTTPQRALALAESCIAPVLQALQTIAAAAQASAPPAEAPPAHPTLVTPRRTAAPKPQLRVLWGVHDQADETVRVALQAQAAEAVKRWSAAVPGIDWHFEFVAVRSGEALLLQAERRLLMAHRDGHDEHLLVLAAESWIDDALVAQLDAAGQLFTAQRRAGLMPGEAAAALLLAPPLRDAAAAPESTVLLHRLSAQRRDKSADAAGRISADTMTEALRQLLDATALPPEQITQVLCDTDLRPSRTSELFATLQALLPPLAAVDSARCAGVATGTVGVASAPLALALAAARVQRQREATLVLTHADPFDRLAAVLSAAPSSSET